jgi:hypothetical protein
MKKIKKAIIIIVLFSLILLVYLHYKKSKNLVLVDSNKDSIVVLSSENNKYDYDNTSYIFNYSDLGKELPEYEGEKLKTNGKYVLVSIGFLNNQTEVEDKRFNDFILTDQKSRQYDPIEMFRYGRSVSLKPSIPQEHRIIFEVAEDSSNFSLTFKTN